MINLDSRIFGIIFALLLVTGCATPTGQVVSDSENIKIGAILMLTGLGSTWGENSQLGAELAVEEINAQGGVNGRNLEVAYEDNKGDDPRTAVNALRKLNEQDIELMLGPNWSPSGLATAPIACEEGTVMISPTLGLADFNEECDSIFNLWPHDDESSESLGRYVYEEGHRSVAILGSLQVWEKQQAEAVRTGFEEAGGKVTVFALPQGDDKNLRTEALKILAAEVDAVVFTNQGHISDASRRLREIGVEAPFFSILIDNDHIEAAGGTLEGTIVITPLTPSDEFQDKFVSRYGEKPDVGSDTSYDVVMLLAEAVEETGSADPKDVENYINSLEYFDGASGHLVFDGKGGIVKDPVFKIVKDSELVDLE